MRVSFETCMPGVLYMNLWQAYIQILTNRPSYATAEYGIRVYSSTITTESLICSDSQWFQQGHTNAGGWPDTDLGPSPVMSSSNRDREAVSQGMRTELPQM